MKDLRKINIPLNTAVIDFDEFTSSSMHDRIHGLERVIDEFLSQPVFTEAEVFFSGFDAICQAYDVIIKPVDHLLKVTRDDDLNEQLLNLRKARQNAVKRMMEHDAFRQFVIAGTDSTSILGDEFKRFRTVLNKKSQLLGLALPKNQRDSIAELSNEIVALQSSYRKRVTDASSSFGEQMATVSKSDERYARKKAWIQRYTANLSDQHDTRPIITKILDLRKDLSHRLGADNYAELMAGHRAAGSTDVIDRFILNSADRILPEARNRLTTLKAFAATVDSDIKELQPWDISYLNRLYLEKNFSLPSGDEDKTSGSRIFQLNHSLDIIVEVIDNFFGIQLNEVHGLPVWHPDVRVFDWFDSAGRQIGRQYLDLFTRPGEKSIGAWKSSILHGCSALGREQLPVCGLQCNFPRGKTGETVYLAWDEVKTLFHEFGHCLHELCCQLRISSLSGTQVDRDILEFPSSFMELYSQQPAIMKMLGNDSGRDHEISNETLKILQERDRFMAPFKDLRRLKLAWFDYQLHKRNLTDIAEIHELYLACEKNYGLVEIPASAWPETSFNHIFAGDYAVGYYGYLYALEYAQKAITVVSQSQNPMDPVFGDLFKRTILATGNSRPMTESLDEFGKIFALF